MRKSIFIFLVALNLIFSSYASACAVYPAPEVEQEKVSDVIFEGTLLEHSKCGDKFDYAKFRISKMIKGNVHETYTLYFYNCRAPMTLKTTDNYLVHAYKLAVYADLDPNTQFSPISQLGECFSGIAPIKRED